MNNIAKFDPLLFKFPKGPIVKGNSVTFKVKYFGDVEPKIAYFMIKNDIDIDYKYLEMKKTDDGYEFTYNFNSSGHYWYNFQFVYENYCIYLNKTYDFRSETSNEKGEDYLQLVLNKQYECENSLQGGIIYQIYVDRFNKFGEVKTREPLIFREDWGGMINKNTDDPLIINLETFGGNIQGIIQKLDYLKELGVTTIYLNPISLANSNHKYNTSDYMRIDDMYGTDKDFKELIDKAKQKGIGIIIDGVYNHTGSDSIYFNKENRFNSLGAYQSKKSKYYPWYVFYDYPNKYMSWWGIDTLPSINDKCEEFQDFIAGDNGVLDKYLKMGVAGVRLDVVDEITDSFVKKIEDRVHKYGKNKVVMGEVWEDASIKISYSKRRTYFSENELNSVMNYPIKETIIQYIKTHNASGLESAIRMLENNYPKVVKDNLMNFLTTHDTTRIFTEILNSQDGDEQKAITKYKIATVLLFTLPGVPSIFYGDEYGMQNNAGSSRGCFDWKNYKNEIYKWFLKITKVRKLPCLKDGEMNVLYSKYGKFVFERFNDESRIVVLTNLAPNNLKIKLNGKYKSFITGKLKNDFVLKENEFDILIEEK